MAPASLSGFRTSGAIHGGPALLPEAILVMTFVIISKVIGLLRRVRSTWLHGNSTLRRCLLCSIQKAFFASSSSASWHASFSTDFSPGCHAAFALARRYISADLRNIFLESKLLSLTPGLVNCTLRCLFSCIVDCSPTAPAFHSLKHLGFSLTASSTLLFHYHVCFLHR